MLPRPPWLDTGVTPGKVMEGREVKGRGSEAVEQVEEAGVAQF